MDLTEAGPEPTQTRNNKDHDVSSEKYSVDNLMGFDRLTKDEVCINQSLDLSVFATLNQLTVKKKRQISQESAACRSLNRAAINTTWTLCPLITAVRGLIHTH